MSTWLINDVTPESLGLTVVGGNFRSGSASSIRLRRVSDFDASEILGGYNGAVIIKRNGSVFFKGKVRTIPKSADDSNESQEYLVEDAWSEMERTVYQEAWATGGGSSTVLMPRVYLGVSAAGSELSIGGQIREAIDFAHSAGIDIQVGTIPEGMILWPTEVDCISIAEVIRTSLQYYPDWLPWIDHTTTPPTFNVTPRATAAAMSLAVSDCRNFDVTEIQDRLPDVVRIVYVTASEVDGSIYRDYAVDKYPLDGDDSGPGVLCTTVDLQGVKSQIQKQQVQCRHIPTTISDSTLDAKNWLKHQYPCLNGVATSKFEVTSWELALVPETEDPPDPINPSSTRLGGPGTTITLSDLPRQLVKGTIPEWARRKVGRVHITWSIAPASGATGAENKAIDKVPPGLTVTATNAVTRIYKSLASWTPGESAPSGIAEAYYNTIHNGAKYEGSVAILTADLTPPWHGKKLNITGGVAGWSTMASPIHSVGWDADTEEATISFGPTPEYGFADFMQYLHLLRGRTASWISSSERTSSTHGNELGASAGGDSVGPFDGPNDVTDAAAAAAATTGPFRLSVAIDGSDWKWTVSATGSSITDGTNGAAIDLSTAGFGTAHTFSTTTAIVLKATVSSSLVLTDWTLAAVSDSDEVGFNSATPPVQNEIRLLIGKVSYTSGSPSTAAALQACFSAQRITHGFLNGCLVKVFESAPTNASNL